MTETEQADFDFLLAKADKAGTINFKDDRDCGVSSNSIVRIVYDVDGLNMQELPSDEADLEACENMWKKLPEHRKTFWDRKAMERARKAIKK